MHENGEEFCGDLALDENLQGTNYFWEKTIPLSGVITLIFVKFRVDGPEIICM